MLEFPHYQWKPEHFYQMNHIFFFFIFSLTAAKWPMTTLDLFLLFSCLADIAKCNDNLPLFKPV